MTNQTAPARSVLVAEDEDYLREGLVKLLTEEGWEVHEARDGVEALEIFRAKPIEVVLTDLLMPRLDGISFLRKIREIDPDVPTIVFTGYGSMDRCVETLRAGATDFLHKPCDNDTLLAALERAWRSRICAAIPVAILEETVCRMRLRFPADAEIVAGAVAGVEAAARASGYLHRRWAIRRAAEEAISNAIRHGGAQPRLAGGKGDVVVEARFGPETGSVRVSDPGSGFTPPPAGDYDPASEKRGILLIRSFADEARWIPPGNAVEMIFKRRS